MAKTTIKGQFATGTDVATVHHISAARRKWLDREIGKATEQQAVVFTVVRSKAGAYKNSDSTKSIPAKRNGSKRSGKTVRLRAKKK